MGIGSAFRNLTRRAGFEVIRFRGPGDAARRPPELGPYDSETLQFVAPFTMTSEARIYSLIKATRYIARHKIPGAVVECGVWKGGSMMAAARTLLDARDGQRELFLYDTFEGMPPPSDLDRDFRGAPAAALLETANSADYIWARAQLDVVKQAMALIPYEPSRIHFVQGKVEETIPETSPEKIALLRLDTDWHESTRHELTHLYPRLSNGGVIIIDDYGYWQGARAAVDEYIEQNNVRLLLNVIDDTGRIGVKID